MSHQNIQYAVISTTGACNLSCRHCFRVEVQDNYLSYEKFVSLLAYLKSIGVKHINFTGGEPLLNPDIEKMINISKEHGFENILSTNGLLLSSLKDKILNDIFCLCLPLDGDDSLTNDSIRGNGHFEKVLTLINEYGKERFNFKLKINTLVTANNIKNLKNLPRLLNIVPSIHLKLFQVSARGEVNYTHPDDFISDEEFLDLYSYIKATFPHLSINYLMGNTPANYIILDSTGLPKFIQDDEYIIMRNIQELPFKENSFEQTSLGI